MTFLEDGGDQRGSEAAVVGSVNTLSQMGGPAVGGGRQLVPGLIMMPDGSALHGFQQVQPQGEHLTPRNVSHVGSESLMEG